LSIPHYLFHAQAVHTGEALQFWESNQKKKTLRITDNCIPSKNRISMPEDRESRKQNAILIQKPYSIEAPSMEDNHTVKSPPQAA